MTRFERAASALAYSMALERAGDDPAAFAGPYNDAARFVLERVALMPAHLRVPLKALTVAFDVCGIVRGRAFHAQAPETRARQIARWSASGLRPAADLMRFYRSLSAFALYSRLEGRA